MTPLTPTPDWAVSLMKTANKYDDQDVLDAVLKLVTGLTGLNDEDRDDPSHVAIRDDAARAALAFGYRNTADCDEKCNEYLGIAV